MSAFGQRGVALLKEIINHESDSLSAYNVRSIAWHSIMSLQN
jgi:hypothetical protein